MASGNTLWRSAEFIDITAGEKYVKEPKFVEIIFRTSQ
jgi:hypothetical protein